MVRAPPVYLSIWDDSVVNFDEIVVVILIGCFVILEVGVVVLVIRVIVLIILFGVVEDVERQLDPELGEQNVVIGEERVTQRQLGCFERGVIGLVSIAGDVEVVLEGVQQARQRAARISDRRPRCGSVRLRRATGKHPCSVREAG